MIIELIDAVLYNEDTVLATVDKTDDDGVVTRMAHMIPREAVEWRAAEYGIDPGDTETLLDLILHEPHVQIDPSMGLYQASDPEEAKAHLLGKVQERKAESALGQSRRASPEPKGKAPDPRGKLLSLLHLDREAIELKAQMVGLQMAHMREQARRAQTDRADRISRLKNNLKEMKNASHVDASPGTDEA